MESAQVCAPKNAQELLLEFRITGRQEPFEELVRRYAGMVYHVCMQVTKNAHDAEDATQAVFLTLAVQAKTAKEIRSLGPWLQQVGKRLSLDLRKSKRRRQKREERHGRMSDRNHNHNGNGNDGSLPLQVNELKDVLNEELHNLPAKYRMPLVLHYFGGLSREAMAAELQCKPGTLGARLHRGRAMLGQRLAERGVTLRDGALAGALSYSVCMAVTDTLVSATSEAATRLAAGREIGVGLISANVVGMVRRAIQMALYAKLKALGVGILLAGTLVAGAAEIVARTGPVQLRWTSPVDLGSRLWPLVQPLFRPSYSNATVPVKSDTGRTAFAMGGRGTATYGARGLDWTGGSTSRPEWSGPLLSEVKGGVTPYLFPERSAGITSVALPGGGWAVDQMAVSAEAAKGWMSEGPMVQPLAGPLRTETIVPAGFRAAVAGGGPPLIVRPMVTESETIPTTELRPLMPAVAETASRPVGPVMEPTGRGANLPERSSGGGALGPQGVPIETPLVKGPTRIAVPEPIEPLANRDLGRHVLLVSPEAKGEPTDQFAAAETSLRSPVTGAAMVTPSLDAVATTLATAGWAADYASGNSSTMLPMANAAVLNEQEMMDGEFVGIPAIPLRGVRIGPPTILRGWGIVENTNTFDQSGQVIADGLGSSQTLDLSRVQQIVHTMESPVGVGTNGWFARDGGKLTLPPISVASGTGRYTWGDTAGDIQLDLINSVQIGLENVTKPGSLSVSLLAIDRLEVPALPTGHHFVGLWEFGGAGLVYDAVDLTVRYDTTLVATLGLDESKLKLWKYDAGRWEVVTDSVSLDRVQKLISGKTNTLSYFAVSTPEPGGLVLLGFGAALLMRRRRRV